MAPMGSSVDTSITRRFTTITASDTLTAATGWKAALRWPSTTMARSRLSTGPTAPATSPTRSRAAPRNRRLRRRLNQHLVAAPHETAAQPAAAPERGQQKVADHPGERGADAQVPTRRPRQDGLAAVPGCGQRRD